MANVMFKRGTQSALNTLKTNVANNTASFVDGSFYLTTDTNRLYVAQSDSNLVELNKSISIVDSVANLPGNTGNPNAKVEVGQFYYVTGTNLHNGEQNSNGNILAVVTSCSADGTNPTWVQVNPDTDTNTNDNTKVSSITVAKNTTSSNSSQIVYDLTINQTTSHISGSDNSEPAVVGTLTLSSSDITSIVTNVAVDVTNSAVASNKTTVSLTGTGVAANADGFVIEGGDRVTLADSADTAGGIKINTPLYNVNSPAVSGATAASSATINLGVTSGSDTAYGTVTVKAGEDLAINNTTAGEFTIYHVDSGVTAGSYGISASTTPAAGGKIKIPNITVDAQGHLTSASDQEITLPADEDSYITSVTAAATGGTFSVTHAGSRSNTVTSGEVLFYNIDKYAADGTKTTTKVDNQGNLGEYYTKTAIDDLLKGINAVTYKGTVFGTGATESSLPKTDVHNGDAYLASADSGSYHSGDLIIATGTESNGTIPSNDITWTVISSGSDADTTYSFGTSSTSLTYTPSTGSATTFATIAGGNKLTASESSGTITIDHDASTVTAGSYGISASTTPAVGGKIKIPNITVDSYGHLTAASDQEITLPSVDSYSLVQNSENPAQVKLLKGSGSAGDVTFVAGTRTSVTAVGSTTKTIAFNHTAPTAHTVNNGDSAAGPSANASPSASGTFVVPEIYYDSLGHITGSTNRTITLPADNNTTYTLSAAAATLSSADQTAGYISGTIFTLDGSEGTDSTITIKSKTLTMGADSIDLVWGTF